MSTADIPTPPDVNQVAPPTAPAPSVTQAPAAGPQAPKPSLWRNVLSGALAGLANSGGSTSFGGGLAAGAAGEMGTQARQREQARQNQSDQDQHALATARVANTYADIAHTQQIMHNEPPDWQIAQTEKLADQTAQMLGKGLLVPQGPAVSDWHQAQDQVTALMQKDPTRLYMAMPVRGEGGKLVFQAMESPNSPTQSDYTFTMPDGTKTIVPKGAVRSSDLMGMEVKKIQQQMADQSSTAKANTLKAQAAMVKANKTGEGKENPAALVPDALGFQPKLPVTGAQGYQKAQSAFKKNADDLSQTEQTYQQFNDILKDAAAGKDLTGAQSIVGLFNAIGISAEPLKGKGFRINNLTVAEHAGARGIRQAIEQKVGRLKTGEIITPQQLQDYAHIAEQVRENKYVSLVNQAHNAGLNADFAMPTGNGQKADPSTARIFLRLVGWTDGKPTDKQKQTAQAAMQKKGWSF